MIPALGTNPEKKPKKALRICSNFHWYKFTKFHSSSSCCANTDLHLQTRFTIIWQVYLYRSWTSPTFSISGDVIAYAASDKNFKDDLTVIPNALDKINTISGYTFTWNDKQTTYDTGKKDVGVVAQEIETVLPEIVDTRFDGSKAVKYDRIVALLIEGIKELQEEVKELKDKCNGCTC